MTTGLQCGIFSGSCNCAGIGLYWDRILTEQTLISEITGMWPADMLKDGRNKGKWKKLGGIHLNERKKTQS